MDNLTVHPWTTKSSSRCRGLVEPLPAVKFFHGLGDRMPHLDRYRLDIDIVVQISLAERPAAHTDIEFDIEIAFGSTLGIT